MKQFTLEDFQTIIDISNKAFKAEKNMEGKIFKHYDFLRGEKKPENKYSKNMVKYNAVDVSDLLETSKQHLSIIENKNNFKPEDQVHVIGNKKVRYYYSEDIYKIRGFMGKLKKPLNKAVFVTVNNLKGGVGKTTIAVSYAQYLSLQGYRVLLVDADPQGTTTSCFNYLPDIHFKQEDTLAGVVAGDKQIQDIVLDTHFYNLCLIPSCLELQNCDAHLISNPDNHQHIKKMFDVISTDFDFILFDTAPSMSFLTTNVLVATDYLLVPVVPSMFDVTSVVSYFNMLKEVHQELVQKNTNIHIKDISVIVNKMSARTMNEQNKMLGILHFIFGKIISNLIIYEYTEIQRNQSEFNTIYEKERKIGSKKDDSYRILELFNNLFKSITKNVLEACDVSH